MSQINLQNSNLKFDSFEILDSHLLTNIKEDWIGWSDLRDFNVPSIYLLIYDALV